MINRVSIGERVRGRREALELTQQDLADAISLTSQHISAIELDKRAPSLTSLAKLAEELGVTVDYLVTGKEGVMADTIPAIKADKSLTLKLKRALIAMVEEIRATISKETVSSDPPSDRDGEPS